jgi:sigma-B regulation protein RsbU (phosphoserine phosphatase)
MDSLLDTLPCGFLSFTDDGQIVQANATLLEMLGRPSEEVVGHHLETLLPVGGRILYQTHFFPLLRMNGRVDEFYLALRPASGPDIPVLVNAARHEREGSVRYDCVLMAMQRRNQYEDELLHAKRTAENATRERNTANDRLIVALARERKIALALQRALTQMPAQDAFAGLNVHAVYEPAWAEADIGGDFMDAFLLDSERMAVVVGDVSGKGLGAAARTAETKYTLRGMLYERRSPAAALSDLNKYLCDAQQRGAGGGEEFVCASVAVVECATGKAVVSVAGAEPPLYVRTAGGTQEAQVRGTPLGVFGEMEYRNEETYLNAGDLLLLTTDGITEARKGSEFFGYDGLTSAVARLRHTPSLSELADWLVDEARIFAGGALHDDACLLLVRRV